jgi:hypothetical protein
MKKLNQNIEMIETIVSGLGELLNDVVFVGGSTVSLYIDSSGTEPVRTTLDVDFIVKLATKAQMNMFDEKLRDRGFTHCMDEGAPICRWQYKGVLVDVMPTGMNVLGFSNEWYEEGLKNRKHIKLPGDKLIYILPLYYFLATKIAAFLSRGKGDYLESQDIEDIITVLDGQENLELNSGVSQELKEYLKKHFRNFARSEYFKDVITSFANYSGDTPGRAKRLIDFFKTF